MKFLDSNIPLRYITEDDPRAQQQAADILERIRRGDDEAFTTDVQIHETAYVLASRSLHGLSHVDIHARLKPLLSMRGLKLSNTRTGLVALDIFAANSFLAFADALAIATMRRKDMTEVYGSMLPDAARASYRKHDTKTPRRRRPRRIPAGAMGVYYSAA